MAFLQYSLLIIIFCPSSNIVVNNRAMYYKGDIRPIVKRVRPYKTLLINLPPKSFGFWVLANTKIEACHDVELNEIDGKTYLEAIPVTDISDKLKKGGQKRRIKRTVFNKKVDFEEVTDFPDFSDDDNASFYDNKLTNRNNENELNKVIDKINKDLQEILDKKVEKNVFTEANTIPYYSRIKREIKSGQNLNGNEVNDRILPRKKIKKAKHILSRKNGHSLHNKSGVLTKLVELNSKYNQTRLQRLNRLTRRNKPIKKIIKRLVDNRKYGPQNLDESIEIKKLKSKTANDIKSSRESVNIRRRRNIDVTNETDSIHNEVDIDDNGKHNKIHKMMRKLKKSVQRRPVLANTKLLRDFTDDKDESEDIIEELVLKTTISDDDASIKVTEKSNKPGVLKATVESLKSLLDELKDKTDNIWNILNVLD